MTNKEYYFLQGGGEMGELIRNKDWSKTPLGTPDIWPQSLRTSLGIILNSKFPMFLWWGDELTCFYNDAYRPSLGNEGKHPEILGQKAEDAWPEIWPIIYPLIQQVLAGEGSTWSENQLIPIYRNGKIEDVYWTFSYSPVHDESGKIAGVMVICSETTENIHSLKKLEESNNRYLNNIIQAPTAMCVFRGKNHVVEIVNDMMLEIWGKSKNEVINKPIFEGLPEAKGQGLESVLDKVYETGEKFVANEHPVNLPRNAKIETTYINFVYEALKEADGTISGIVAIAIEVTEQIISRSKIEESEHKIRALVENAPFAIAVYTGEEMIIELANESIINIWGKGNDVIGKSFMDLLPELTNQLVFEQIKNVYRTGQPFHTENTPLDLLVDGNWGTYYFNYQFTPLYDLKGNIYGVMNTGLDLTDLNLAKKRIEESEENLRSMVLQSPIGICVLDAATLVTEIVNDSFIEIAGKPYDEIAGKYYWDAFAEVKSYYEEALKNVVNNGIPFYINEVEMILVRYGKEETIYVTFVYAPLKNIEGEVKKVAIWVLDNTPQVKARREIEEANKQFRNTVKQAPVGITILRGQEHIVEMANEAYLKLVDRDEASFIGRPLFDSLPEVKETVSSLLDAVLNTGIPYHGNEVPVPLKRQGIEDVCYFDFLYHPLKEEDGKISGIIVTVTEVTEKVEAKNEIEQNEQRLNIIVEASELGTWELNVKTKELIYSNRYLEIIGGYKEYVELTHEQLLKHVHRDDLHIREKAFKHAIASGHLYYEARVIWTDGSVHWVEAKGKVFYDADNKLERLLGTARDITELKKHQQELEESEQKFRLLASSMPQHIWTSDTDGHLNYCNKSVYTYSGLTPKQIAEEGWLQIVHPDERAESSKVWMESIATGKDFLFEHRFKRHDGVYRWQLSRASPQIDENGKIQMWVGTSTDIEDQKTFTNELEKLVKERTKELSLINESLRKSEERYHLMVEEVQDYAILYLNHEGIVENWNIGAEKIKGYKAEQIIGKSFSIFYTEEDRKNNLPNKLLQLARERGKAVQEGWRIRKDRSLFWSSAVITAIHNKKGEVIGFSKVTHDLTEKKKAEDKLKLNALELEQKNIELEQMNKELQSFAYISSHDLQEPLRKIQTFATQIIDRESDNLSDVGKDKFQRMQNAAKRMQTLINDLLAYSRTNVQERIFEKTDLSAIIDEVKEDLREELELHHAVIEKGKTYVIDVIPFQFRQLLYNLVSNSLKFSKPELPASIKVNSKIIKGVTLTHKNVVPDIDYCHISISDNGIGFDQQYSAKIFEVFQRLHGKMEYTGTGIGLAIVKKIVENHNGFITASGEQNKGATFDIYIPVNQKKE
ncbi:PAS domain S-box protein [Flavobacterium chungangense]|uniref:histidine kinase n=1 Tax=Flavobacterium chungangense TaxID=554283 RepID=A0A6V6Z2P3_9FLAO|nr:PAS domain S-box protein [Flavobacterium chungangense]CAD0006021.1 Adaptive-response sensory-kinase SasA [Flavobacterium chungangense]